MTTEQKLGHVPPGGGTVPLPETKSIAPDEPVDAIATAEVNEWSDSEIEEPTAPPLSPGVETGSLGLTPLELEVELPCGLLLDGERLRKVTITPLTPRDRKTVFDKAIRNNSGKIVTKLLLGKITDMEGRKPTEKMIRGLTTADRDYLVLKIGQLTHGDDMDAGQRCTNQSCLEEFDVSVDLSKVDIISIPDGCSATETVEAFCIKDDKWYWETTIARGQSLIPLKMYYPTGDMQEKLPRMQDMGDLHDYECKFFQLMLFDWNNLGRGLTKNELETMDYPTFQKLEEVAAEHRVGAQLVDSVQCPECGAHQDMAVDIMGFLFGGTRKATNMVPML